MDVGVVVPARAPAPYLAAALDSVLAQEPPPREVVVVDDASDPPLPLDPRVTWIPRPTRGGPGAARNDGIAALDTEWVAFCDADDEWLPGKLAAQATGDADVRVGTAEIVDAAGNATGETWPPFRGAENLYASNPILLSSVLVRRELLVDGFDAELMHAEDWDLWLRLAAAGARFAATPEARVRYRRHADGLTADIAALARAQLIVHRRHGASVAPETQRRAVHRDLVALAEGLARERRWAESRQALREAGELGPVPLPRRARLLPGVRSLVARRDPYRRRG